MKLLKFVPITLWAVFMLGFVFQDELGADTTPPTPHIDASYEVLLTLQGEPKMVPVEGNPTMVRYYWDMRVAQIVPMIDGTVFPYWL